MAIGVSSGELQEYFSSARSWDHDRAVKAESEKLRAFLFAGAAGLIAAGTLVWHVAAPLKTVEPYVIRVNQNSGGVDVVNVAKNTHEVTADEAVRKFFLSEYIRNRESWVAAAANEMFKTVAVLSAPDEQEKITAERRPENATSPVNLYKNGETIGVRVNNVTFINERVAQVRFTKMIRSTGAVADQPSQWVATINFRFVNKPETEADRLYNPLGFQVVSYRADPEISK